MRSKPRVLVLNGTCLDVAEAYPECLISEDIEIVADPSFRTLDAARLEAVLSGAHGVILPASTSLQAKHMEAAKSLRVISIAASGYEWLDLASATRCGIAVTHAPVREGAEAVADMTLALMLAVARQLPFHYQKICLGRPERRMTSSLWGKTLGIVGLGNIGKAVARRARGFDMPLLAFTPHPDPQLLRQQGIQAVALEELLRRADFVSLHARLHAETQGMIGARELGWMKPTAFLINTARQQLVDEEALARALLSGRIAGAAMDDPPANPSSPLPGLPNFVCTPHLGNRVLDAARAVFLCALENARAVLRGRRPPYLLNPQIGP